MLLVLISCKGNLSQTLLFEDEFDHLPRGFISNGNGSLMKHYYISGSGQSGSWTVSAFGPDREYHTAWEIMENDGEHFLRQNYHAVNSNLEPLNRHIHPMIIAGDSHWHDYKIEFSFSPGQLLDKCGIVFKYQNSRCYYFYGMEGNMLVLKMVKHATAPYRPFEKILASTPFKWVKGDVYKGDVSVKQNRIYTLLNDSLSMIAEDNTYERGKVGFLSDVPADFFSMEVSTLNREKRKLNRFIGELSTAKAQRINENPETVVWKRIPTKEFGAGKSIRFGDLNSDGEIDILIGQIEHSGPKNENTSLTCLTALTIDGDILWQKGVPDPDRPLLTGDIGFQIHDLDADGSREVVCIMNSRIMILDGKTGSQIRSKPLPNSDLSEGITKGNMGTSVFFCDLQGKGRDSDIIIRDNFNNLWAYDEHLRLLWKQKSYKGYFPYAIDLDDDGKDEILAGYSLIDSNGTIIWSREGAFGDHANAVVAASLNPATDTTEKIIYGAGDWGTLILDTEGNTLIHHPVGHVHNLSIANFRSDLPGLEMISINFWGNQGLVCFYNSQGDIYHSFDSGPYGSMCLPVNWRGDGQEYFLLNTNSGDGGLFDGNGQLVVSFPDDGHPDLCSAVLDLTGDYRDEIITWDQHSIWIYTQVDNTRKGKVYNPVRNPHYNYSNYQLTLSEPGWSD
jgi:rhamnogalacturonan endolyase